MATASKNLSSYNEKDIPDASGFSFVVIVSEWNTEITYALKEGCTQTLLKHGVKNENIKVIHVPGSFELPVAASIYLSKQINGKMPNAVICLGSVIRGETPHFDYVCQAVSQGIKDVAIKYNIPVIFGVLTDNNWQQAKDRSGGKHGNKGIEAALTAIKMAHLIENF